MHKHIHTIKAGKELARKLNEPMEPKTKKMEEMEDSRLK